MAYPEEKTFRNNLGKKVMAGAMGIGNVKDIDGKKVNLLRLICILCPINAYMRKMMGDSWSLPQKLPPRFTVIAGGGIYLAGWGGPGKWLQFIYAR